MFNLLSLFVILLVTTSCTIHDKASKKFNTLIKILDHEYFKEVNSSKLTNDAIQKIISELDHHSIYLNSNDLENYLISTRGEYGGIGITMNLNKSILTIIYTHPNSPAQKFGILPGDIILKINNHSTLGLSLDTCSNLANGKIGETLHLTIIRKSEKKALLFKIKREKIKTNPLKSKIFLNNILYVKIPIFNDNISKELKNILKKNISRKGLILDLRSNPGGILSEAVSIVDMFINKGLIVSQKGRTKNHTRQFTAHEQNSDTQTEMVILIDAYSASASEIVAGALKVYKRATLIGEKSYGKGTVQSTFSLSANSAVKLTTAKYYLPNHKSIDKIGVKPDIYIKTKQSLSKNIPSLSEKKIKQILKKIDKGSIQIELQKEMQGTKNKDKEIKLDKVLKKAIYLLNHKN